MEGSSEDDLERVHALHGFGIEVISCEWFYTGTNLDQGFSTDGSRTTGGT